MYVAKLMVSYLVKLHLFKIILRLYQNHTPTLPKSHSDFHKITAWFGWLIFTKSHSDFTKITIRFSQNHTPTLPKSHSDFHKITAWFSQHHWLIFTKSHSDFVKITLRLYQNRRLICTKSKITDWFSQKRGLILKPQIVVLLYAVSKSHPPPLCVLLVRRFQQFRHEPAG